MELRTGRVPARRVLVGDDGAPLDHDRVLALALRWGEQPLSLEHVRPGSPRAPLEGVELRWEGPLPLFALADGVRAWVEREGQWAAAGRRLALEPGEALVVDAGEVVLEARLQRKAARLPKTRAHENFFFGLVVTHALMIFTAAAVALAITPRVDEPSWWGAPNALRRLASTPFTDVPRPRSPQLEERVKELVARRDFSPQQPSTRSERSALSVVQRLLGGGGGVFGAGLGAGIDAALSQLGGGQNAMAGDGLVGVNARNLGGGLGGDGLSLGGLPGAGPGAASGPPGGLRAHRAEIVLCRDCNLTPQGYDRELILKVVRRHQNEIRFCYESELQKTPELAGKVTVAWTIGPTGAVESAEIAESGLSNANVEACIVQKVRRWSFPEPQGGQEVAITFPWVFQVAGAGD
ncbi:MAG: AgmX/PglI C-terminal domain-containing protein [Myxococcota bacterium]